MVNKNMDTKNKELYLNAKKEAIIKLSFAEKDN